MVTHLHIHIYIHLTLEQQKLNESYLKILQIHSYLFFFFFWFIVPFLSTHAGAPSSNDMNAHMRKFMYLFCAMSPFITMNFQAGVVLYFAASSYLGFLQTCLLKTKFLKKTFNIPDRKVSTSDLLSSSLDGEKKRLFGNIHTHRHMHVTFVFFS